MNEKGQSMQEGKVARVITINGVFLKCTVPCRGAGLDWSNGISMQPQPHGKGVH